MTLSFIFISFTLATLSIITHNAMFKQEHQESEKINILQHNSPETVIGKSVFVTGDLVAEGDIVVDGKLKGSVKTKGFLRVGEGAELNADVEAGDGVVGGTVKGKVLFHGHLELLGTAVIQGDIVTSKITVSQGAVVNGTIQMSGSQPLDLDVPAINRKHK